MKTFSQQTRFPITSVNLLEAVDGVSQSFHRLDQRYSLKPFSGWAIKDEENRYPSSWRKDQTTGGIASGLSHLDVARLASEKPSDGPHYVLVMEDDCVLTSEVASVYPYFVTCLEEANEFRPGWDMLMLGAAGHRIDIAEPRPIPGSFNVEKAGFSYLTTMYLLSPEGVGKWFRNRDICIRNCLAFDELHNAVAGLNKRPDVINTFAGCERINLISSTQSLVRQDPQDGVHDTNVIASGRRRSVESFEDEDEDVLPPGVEIPLTEAAGKPLTEAVVEYPISVWVKQTLDLIWFRRSKSDIPPDQLREEMGISDQQPESRKSRKSSEVSPPIVEIKKEPAVPSPAMASTRPRSRMSILGNSKTPSPVASPTGSGGQGLMTALMQLKAIKLASSKPGPSEPFPASFDWYERGVN